MLTVAHHTAGYVYPILAGAGWEGGFTTLTVPGPMDEQEIREEEERRLQEEQEALNSEMVREGNVISTTSPPEPVTWAQAGIDEFPAGERQFLWNANVSGGPMLRHYAVARCPALAAVDNVFSCGNPWKGEAPGLSWTTGMRATYIINRGVAVWHLGNEESGINCAEATYGGPNSILQAWEVECRWKHKKTTASRNWIAARGDWHIFFIDGTHQDLGYEPLLQQLFVNGDRRALEP